MDHQASPAPQSDFPPERAQALEEASRLQDESQAAEFLLHCSWPDARLKAAERLESRALLEHVLGAVRNSDRRVEKLLQQKLDVLSRRESAAIRGQQALEQARKLAEASALLVNQVADLDREWSQVGPAPEEVVQQYSQLRDRLSARLDEQMTLQKSVRDLSLRLQQLVDDAQPGGRMPPPDEVSSTLDALESEMAALCAHPEAPSLPRRLLAEFRQKHQALKEALGSLQARYEAVQAHEALLAEWEAREPQAEEEAALRAAWQALPALAGNEAPLLAQRYAALLARLAGTRQSQADQENERRREARQAFAAAMDAMEAALKEGALHEAAAQEHKLRDMDLALVRLRGDQKVRLQNARAELSRLQGWAKWGGKMSREELLRTAQDLPARNLPVAELAREVSGLREKWKAIDGTAGPASKEAWQRFDAACTTAYAPAAEHFKKLSQERQENLERARALVTEVQERATQLEQAEGEPDWKTVAGFCDRVQQQWRRLGAIDRKPKKSLDADFAAALARLTGPLSQQQSAGKQERLRLIEAAQALDPAQRRAPEQLQELQQRWQQHARQLPLGRHDEHALWQRFRAACDELYAKRKQHVKSADAERHAHLHEREAICQRLEAAAGEKPEAIRAMMREAKGAWTRAGSVPRSSEKQIEQRFTRAIAALQKRLDEGEKSARQQRAGVLAQRFLLCSRLEGLLGASDGGAAAQARAEWDALPPPASEVDKQLAARFERAIAAIENSDAAYVAQVEKNLPALMHELLRAEILLGMDSPADQARERLKLQVEVLQSSLKSGEKPMSPAALLPRLAQLPAALDGQGEARLRAILTRLA